MFQTRNPREQGPGAESAGKQTNFFIHSSFSFLLFGNGVPEQGPARRFVVRGGARRTPFRGVCPHYSGSCAGMQGSGAAGARIHKLLNSDSYMGRFAASRQTGNGPVPRQTRQGTGPFHPPAPLSSASGVTPAADKNSPCPGRSGRGCFCLARANTGRCVGVP